MPRFHRFRALAGVFLLLSIAACQPSEQAFLPAMQAPAVEEGRYIAPDGAVLPLKRWLPKGKPRAVLVALHGFNDYSNAFAAPAEYFAAQGIATFAYDQRGFGGSPQRGIWGNEENLTRDAARLIDALSLRYPRTPIYLLGESMGGAVAVALLSREQGALPLKGAILSGPALWGGGSMNWFFRSTLWAGAHTIPWYTVTGKGLKIMASDNIPMLIALGKDPQVIKETRIDAIYGLVGLMDKAYERIGEVRVPLLLLYGAHDQVIPPEPVRDAMGRLAEGQRVAYYPDGYHMLMRDLQAEVVWKDVVNWITRPDVPLPSGFDRNWEARMAMSRGEGRP